MSRQAVRDRSCLSCEHRSRLIKEDNSGYEVWCELFGEVVADIDCTQKLQEKAKTCNSYQQSDLAQKNNEVK